MSFVRGAEEQSQKKERKKEGEREVGEGREKKGGRTSNLDPII